MISNRESSSTAVLYHNSNFTPFLNALAETTTSIALLNSTSTHWQRLLQNIPQSLLELTLNDCRLANHDIQPLRRLTLL